MSTPVLIAVVAIHCVAFLYPIGLVAREAWLAIKEQGK